MIKNVNLVDEQMRLLNLIFFLVSILLSILKFPIIKFSIFSSSKLLSTPEVRFEWNQIEGRQENGVTFAFLTSAIFFLCCWRWKQIEINIYVSFNIFLIPPSPPPILPTSIPIHSDACPSFMLDSCTYILWFSIRITIIIVPWCCLFDKSLLN